MRRGAAFAVAFYAASPACKSDGHSETKASPACSAAGVCEVGSATTVVLPRDRGEAVAAGLLEVCAGKLPAAFEGALQAYESAALKETTLPGLPVSLQGVVDDTHCDGDARRRLARGYAELRRDVTHWVGPNLRVPTMAGQFEVGARAVEIVIPYQGPVTYHGEPFPGLQHAVAAQFAEIDDRVVAVVDEEVPWGVVVDHFQIASTFGARDFGLLVVSGDDYGVLALDLPTPNANAAIVVVVDEDGFSFGRPVANTTDRPRVPLLRPGTALDAFDRWDFDGLERELSRRVDEATEGTVAPEVLVMFEPGLPMKVIVATAERIRGKDCNTADISTCRVRRLRWGLGWKG